MAVSRRRRRSSRRRWGFPDGSTARPADSGRETGCDLSIFSSRCSSRPNQWAQGTLGDGSWIASPRSCESSLAMSGPVGFVPSGGIRPNAGSARTQEPKRVVQTAAVEAFIDIRAMIAPICLEHDYCRNILHFSASEPIRIRNHAEILHVA